jgi:hypothetical protein
MLLPRTETAVDIDGFCIIKTVMVVYDKTKDEEMNNTEQKDFIINIHGNTCS